MKHTEFLVKNLDGKTVDLLLKYPDKNLLLIFYNNQCLGCTGRAIPLAYELSQEYDCIQVIGIHVDFGEQVTSEEEIRRIFTIDSLPFPIFTDHVSNLYTTFRCEGTPHWIVIDKQGMEANSIFGSQEGSQNRLNYALLEMCSED